MLAKRALALCMAALNLLMLCVDSPAWPKTGEAPEAVLPLADENGPSTATDLSWFSAGSYAATARYEIAGTAQLAGLAALVNGTSGLGAAYDFAGKTVTLAAGAGGFNLSAFCENGGWTPIGTGKNPFRGVFDGGGATVTDLMIHRGSGADQGLFGVVAGSALVLAGVRNLTVAGAAVEGGDHTGAVVGRASHSAVVGCRVESGTVDGNRYVGGVVGRLGEGSLLDACSVGADVTGGEYTGGLAGTLEAAGVTLRGGAVSGKVAGGSKTGGAAGEVATGAFVEDCAVSGAVSGAGAFTGGVVGYCEGTVARCLATGGVSGGEDTGGVVGGLGGGVLGAQLGRTLGGGALRASANTGPVQGGKHTGGVAGFVAGDDDHLAVLEQCYNTGSVAGGDYTGGIAGHTHGLVQNSYSTGNVQGGSRTGGVTGGLSTFSDAPPPQRGTLRYCYTSGKVAGELYVGGICGSLRGGEISATVAMGPSVTGTVESVTARIHGSTALNVAVVAGNYVWQGLTLQLDEGGGSKAITPPGGTVGAAKQNGAEATAAVLLEGDRTQQPPWNAYPLTGANGAALWNLSTAAPTLHVVPGLQDGSAPPHLHDEPDFDPGEGKAFVNHPNWVEITGEEAYYRYRNDESFIAVYYRADCPQSRAQRALYYTWMARYGVTLYGVRIQADTDILWLFPGVFEAVYSRPVTAFIHRRTLQTCDGAAPAAQVQRAFEDWAGHTPGEPFNFLDIDRETLASYDTSDMAPYLKAEAAIQTGNATVKQKSAQLTQGAATAREKVAAIHAFVSGSVYFDEEMLRTAAGRPTDAAGVLAQAGKSPNKMYTSAQGYANLTAALCRAAGVPCRVVSGFAGQVGSAADAEAMRAACEVYAAEGLEAFGRAASTLRNHVWNAVFLEGEWRYLDTALDSRNRVHISKANGYAPYWVEDAPGDAYLCPPLADFAATHCTWDGDALVAATGFALAWTHVKLPAGMTFQLTPTPLPAGSAFRPGTTFTWEIPESTIATVDAFGLVTALNPGSATFKVASSFGGKRKALSGAITVLEGLDGIRMEAGEVCLHPGQSRALALLPLPAASLITGKPAWTVQSGAEYVTVDENGVVTALAAGQAQVRATVEDAAGRLLAATCTVVVSYPVEEISILPQTLALTVGQTADLTATVAPAGALQRANWRSDDEKVAAVRPAGEAAATVEALGAGTALLWATAQDGGLSALCRVTVKAPTSATLLLAEDSLVLGGDAPATLHLTMDDTAAPVEYELYHASTRWPVATLTDVLASPVFTPVSGTEAELLVQATPGAKVGAYVLRVRAGTAWAECGLTLGPDITAASEAGDFAGLYLDTSAATLWAHGPQNPVIAIRQDRDGRLPLDFVGDARVSLRLKGGAQSKWHGLFAFKGVDGERLEIRHALPEKPASRYNLELEALVDLGGGRTFVLPVKGKLALTVKTGPPKLTAKAVVVNTFVASQNAAEDEALRTVAIQIDGAQPEKIRLREGKKLPDWVTLNPEAQTLTVAAGKTRKSATLYLEVLPKGWAGGGWAAVSLKISRVYTAPGVKLSASKVSVYGDLSRWAGSPLALRPQSGKTTLARLGVTGVTVAPQDAGRFTVERYDPVTGGFVLAAAPGAEAAALGGKVTLLVSVAGTSEVVPLSVRAALVKATATVRLKAAKTTVTLNPGLENGERADIALGTNIPGFDLSGYALAAAVCDAGGKKAPPNSDYAPTASVSGGTLILRAGRHAAPGKTYKVKVTLPGVNRDKKGRPVDSVLTLTLKTARKGMAVRAALSAKGKLDLTTGAKVRITAKFTGTLGGFEGMPTFITMDASGKPLPPETARAFEPLPHPDGGWQLGLRDGYTLKPGNYRVGVAVGESPLKGGGFAASAGTARFAVVASSPGASLSAKTVTLHHNDLDDEARVTLNLPPGTALVAEVWLAGAEKDSFAYTLRPLGDGQYAVVFDQSKPAKTLKNARGRKLTLMVRLAGSTAPAQKLSLTLKVKFRK